MVAATNCERAGDQSRDGGRFLRLAKPAISTTGVEKSAAAKPAISITGIGAGAQELLRTVGRGDCRQGRGRLERPAYLPGSGGAKRLQRFLPIGPTFVRKLKTTQPQRVWRMEARPGEEVQVDFGLGAPIYNGAGRYKPQHKGKIETRSRPARFQPAHGAGSNPHQS